MNHTEMEETKATDNSERGTCAKCKQNIGGSTCVD